MNSNETCFFFLRILKRHKVGPSVTRLLEYLFDKVWTFAAIKICQISYKICQSWYAKYLTNLQRISQTLWFFCQTGEFLAKYCHTDSGSFWNVGPTKHCSIATKASITTNKPRKYRNLGWDITNFYAALPAYISRPNAVTTYMPILPNTYIHRPNAVTTYMPILPNTYIHRPKPVTTFIPRPIFPMLALR